MIVKMGIEAVGEAKWMAKEKQHERPYPRFPNWVHQVN